MSDLLNNKEIQQFSQDGFILIDNAFSEELLQMQDKFVERPSSGNR